MPGVIPQPFFNKGAEKHGQGTLKQLDVLNKDLGVRGIVFDSNTIQIRTSRNNSTIQANKEPWQKRAIGATDQYYNESS